MLIVEDGSIVANADSFLSVADARTLAESLGIAFSYDDATAEITLRQGYLSLIPREPTLQGSRISADQTGVYPRSGVYNNCFAVASDSIPQAVKLAQIYAFDSINSGATINNVDSGERLSGFNVDGVYSETYQDGSRASTNATVQGVVNSLYPLTKVGYAASPCGAGVGGLPRSNMGYL